MVSPAQTDNPRLPIPTAISRPKPIMLEYKAYPRHTRPKFYSLPGYRKSGKEFGLHTESKAPNSAKL